MPMPLKGVRASGAIQAIAAIASEPISAKGAREPLAHHSERVFPEGLP